jgi:LDH2 family malate/lactate/ureidoglycolate dehydrogenase
MVLPRFLVPADQQVLVPAEKMRHATEQLFRACGLTEEGAVQCADVLLCNDLRGNESHGVSNMLRSYVTAFRAGTQNPTPTFRTLREVRPVCCAGP